MEIPAGVQSIPFGQITVRLAGFEESVPSDLHRFTLVGLDGDPALRTVIQAGIPKQLPFGRYRISWNGPVRLGERQIRVARHVRLIDVGPGSPPTHDIHFDQPVGILSLRSTGGDDLVRRSVHIEDTSGNRLYSVGSVARGASFLFPVMNLAIVAPWADQSPFVASLKPFAQTIVDLD